jgi:hypothetical protein
MISVVERHPRVTFFVLAYGLSWGNYILSMNWPIVPFLFPYGPMLAALIVAGITKGRNGLKDILRRCLPWRVGIKWYAVALFLPIAIALVAVSLSILLGAPLSTVAQLSPWYSLFLLFPMAMIDAPLGEEPGWRGYALPGFPANRSPLENTLILGLLLAGWHLPLALAGGSIAAPYLIATIASAVMTNWIYYNASESALLAILYHTAANIMGLYLFPAFSRSDLVMMFWLLAAVNCVVAIIVVLMAKPNPRRGWR